MSKTFLEKFLETYGMLHSFIFIMRSRRNNIAEAFVLASTEIWLQISHLLVATPLIP